MSTWGKRRCQAARIARVWRMPLNLLVPGTGYFASQIPELLAGMGQWTHQPSAPESWEFLWDPGWRQHVGGEAFSSEVSLQLKSQPIL